MAIQDELVGVPARRAAELTGITLARLRRWETYDLVVPSTIRQLSARNTVRLYNFQDLLDLMVVRELVSVVPANIRTLRKLLRSMRIEVAHPWSQIVFAHDSGHLYWQHPDGTWQDGKSPNQAVITGVLDLDLIRARVREGLRRKPEQAGKVVKQRGVMGSKKVFDGTRTPVSAVREFLDAGFDTADILREYPHLTAQDVLVARAAS